MIFVVLSCLSIRCNVCHCCLTQLPIFRYYHIRRHCTQHHAKYLHIVCRGGTAAGQNFSLFVQWKLHKVAVRNNVKVEVVTTILCLGIQQGTHGNVVVGGGLRAPNVYGKRYTALADGEIVDGPAVSIVGKIRHVSVINIVASFRLPIDQCGSTMMIKLWPGVVATQCAACQARSST